MIILHVDISNIVTLWYWPWDCVFYFSVFYIFIMLNGFWYLIGSISIVMMTFISQLSLLLVCGYFEYFRDKFYNFSIYIRQIIVDLRCQYLCGIFLQRNQFYCLIIQLFILFLILLYFLYGKMIHHINPIKNIFKHTHTALIWVINNQFQCH